MLNVNEYMSLVERFADSLARKWNGLVPRDEIYGAGLLGLVEACQSYDETKNSNATGHVSTKIRNAMVNQIRKWVGRDGEKVTGYIDDVGGEEVTWEPPSASLTEVDFTNKATLDKVLNGRKPRYRACVDTRRMWLRSLDLLLVGCRRFSHKLQTRFGQHSLKKVSSLTIPIRMKRQ